MNLMSLATRASSAMLAGFVLFGILANDTARAAQLSEKNLAGQCRAEFKKWKKRGGYGAFAISANGACGFSWDAIELKDARRDATASCRKLSQKSKCQIISELKTPGTRSKMWKACASGDGVAAFNACQSVIKEDKKQAWAFNNRGVYYEGIGELEKALKDYEVALKLKDSDKSNAAIQAENFDRVKARLAEQKLNREKLPSISNKELCAKALRTTKDAWDTNSNYKDEVNEAERRQLTVDQCRLVLGLSQPQQTEVTVNPSNLTNSDVCKFAIELSSPSRWNSSQIHAPFINEAKRRNLTIDECRVAIGLSLESANSTDQHSSIDTKLVQLCNAALNLPRTNWDFNSSADAWAFPEVRARDLSVDDCRLALGLPALTPHKEPILTENASGARKLALVIGNSKYRYAPPLENPSRDAAAIADLLGSIGFEVVRGVDLDKNSTEAVIAEFVDRSNAADVSLLFYAGHGIQVGGENFIVPIDARVEKPSAIDFELVKVGLITNYMGGERSIGIALLDACRDNPFTRSLSRALGTRSSQVVPGLTELKAENGGILVGFATAPGGVADDGVGMKHSPFTTALLKHLGERGVEIELLLKRVKRDVYEMTDGRQQPWHNSALRTEVYLAGE